MSQCRANFGRIEQPQSSEHALESLLQYLIASCLALKAVAAMLVRTSCSERCAHRVHQSLPTTSRGLAQGPFDLSFESASSMRFP
jgi:hypothetical protein